MILSVEGENITRHIIQIFAYSFVLSLLFTWLAMKTALRLDIMDRPDERKKHIKPIPLLGGVAVFAAYALAVMLNFHFSWQLKGVVIASAIMLVTGLADDIRDIPAFIRLLVQIACSLIVVWFGVRLNIVPDSLPYAIPLETAITVFWIVGITNALNFMDGADGLAAGISAIAAGAFFVVAFQTGQTYFAFLNMALVGACLGFLFFNFHPAKIFLGDAGSSFLGFSLATLAVMGEWAESNHVVALSIPLLILAVLIFDMIYISVARVTQGKVRTFKEWIDYVGRDHLHHRLMNMGFSERRAVLFIYLICVVFAFGALVLKNADSFQAVTLLLQGTCILVIITVLMLVGHNHREQLKELQENNE